MRTRYARYGALILVLVLAAAMLPARAGSFDFLFNMSHVSDDNQYFLNLTVGSYGYPRTAVEPVLPRLRYVEDDLPVVLFLASRCHRPLDFIVGLRSKGLTWSVIFTKCGVPVDVLFVGIDRDPGPPYGNAWGYWRKQGRKVRLMDDDIRGLVKVQVGHRLTGVRPFELARAGKTPVVFVAEKKGRPWRAAGPPGHSGGPKGEPPGHAKSHGHGRD